MRRATADPAASPQVAARSIDLVVDLRTVTRWVIGIIAVLYLVNIPAAASASSAAGFDFDKPYVRLVLLDSERNIPTAYACLQLATCGLLAALLGLLARHDRQGGLLRWLGMAVVFAYLTLDEGLGIHEGFNALADRLVPGSGALEHGWIVIGGLMAAAVGAVYLPWVLRLPGWLRTRMVLGGAVFLVGAIALESVGGWIVDRWGFGSPAYPYVSGLEELAELAGIAVFGLALLRHALDRLDDRLIAISRRRS